MSHLHVMESVGKGSCALAESDRRKSQHGRGVYEFDLDVLNNKLA
jgi:hypothetical protein